MENKKQGQVGAYRLMKLARSGQNGFTRSHMELERDLHIVTHEYAEHTSFYAEMNGLLYEYDAEATKLYYEGKTFKNVSKKQDVKKEEDITPFVELNNDNEPATTPASELDVLRNHYEELTGKAANKLWGEKKLNDEIEKLTA